MIYEKFIDGYDALLGHTKMLYDNYNHKGDKLAKDLLSNVNSRQYARDGHDMVLGYYCPNPIEDHVIGGVKRGHLLKGYPSKKEPDFEFFLNSSGALLGAIEKNKQFIQYHYIIHAFQCDWDLVFDAQGSIRDISVWAYKNNKIDFFVQFDTYAFDVSFQPLANYIAWLFEYDGDILREFVYFYGYMFPQKALEYAAHIGKTFKDISDCRHLYKLRENDNGVEYDVYDYHMKENRMVHIASQKPH